MWWATALAIALTAGQAPGAEDPFQQGLEAYLAGDYAKAHGVWQPLAEAGDVVAAFNIGILYAQGLGVAKDPQEAFLWYKRAADADYAPAQFNLGAAYREGAGVDPDMAQAADWWEKAAAQDHPQATFNLATLYLHGNGVERDRDRAQALYQKAADLGDPRAQQILTKLAAAAPPARDETAAAPSQPTPSAAAPPTPAQSPGADSGETPPTEATPVPAPEPQSAQAPAAEKNAKPAQNAAVAEFDSPMSTAPALKNGEWVSAQNSEHLTIQLFAFSEEQAAVKFIRDHNLEDDAAYFRATSRGRIWYKAVYGAYPDMASARAAQERLPTALKANSPWIRRFSAIHSEMQEPQSNNATSAQPTTALAMHRIPAANLAARAKGQSAFNGQDYEQALRVWKPLAQTGDAEAQYSLGFMYESGWGTQKDYQRAYDWYQRAAQQGHPKAQYNLGLLYFRGLGVDQDKGLAYYWIQNAADQQDPRAREFLLDPR